MKRVATAGRPGGSPCRIGMVMLAMAALAAMVGCGRPPQEGAVAGAAQATSSATPVTVSTAMRGSIDETLEITGTAEADDEVDVVTEVAGKVSRVYADVGDYVRRGQTLVRIDTQLAAAQADQAAAGVRSAEVALSRAREGLTLTDETTASAVRQAEVGVAAAKERLEQARAGARLVEAQVTSRIEQARTGVESAETQLAEVRAGARDQQRRQAEAQVRQAKAGLDLAEQTHQRYKSLFDSGVIAAQQYDQVRTEYQVAQATYEQAVEALSLVEEGARTEQVRLAELGVRQAGEQLALAEAGRTQIDVAQQDVRAAEEGVRQAEEQRRAAIAGRRQVDLRERDIAAAQAAIGQAEAGRRLTSVQLSKHVVRAPISGLVAMRAVDPGEGALPGGPVMRLVDIDPIRVNAIVGELDIDRVGQGDRGVVSFDGLGGQDFVGTVTDIAPQAVPGSRNFVVRVDVENPGGLIRPGMFARVELILASHTDTVIVVRDALLERDHAREVFVVSDGTIEIREVEVGAIRGNLVEILSGIRDGDMVVVSGQDALADGQRVVPRQRTPEGEPDAAT